jgi:hypothetical protein
MEAIRGWESSTEHPTLMELQRIQLEALRDGNGVRAANCQEAVFRRLEEAQAAAQTLSGAS